MVVGSSSGDGDGRAAGFGRATLRDVAARAGVSRAVASRALSDHPSVAHATRERVRRAAGELGYRASVVARTLSAGHHAPRRCAVVGLGLRPDELGAAFYGPVLAGLAVQAARESIDTHLVAIPGEAPERTEAFRRLIAEDRADGLVVLTFLPLRPEDVRPLEEVRVPFVLVNRHFDHLGGPPVHCVTLDWVGATRDAVARLVRLGHRRLVLLLPDVETATVWDHAQGWRQGLAGCGMSEAEAPIWRYPPDPDQRASRQLLGPVLAGTPGNGHGGGASEAPTAVVCFNDICAFHVLTTAAGAGVRVPEQLSVVGFDNRIGEYTTPPLCSYDGHLVTLGEEAARLMGAVLRGEQQAPRRVTLPLDFVCRGSCGPPPFGSQFSVQGSESKVEAPQSRRTPNVERMALVIAAAAASAPAASIRRPPVRL